MAKGLDYVNVIDVVMHLDKKKIVAHGVMIGYEIITRSNQDTYSCYSNECP
jgi:hypothetical protein